MDTLRLKKDIIAYPHYEFNEQDKILLLTGQEVIVIGEDHCNDIVEFIILNQGERYYINSSELLSSLEKTANTNTRGNSMNNLIKQFEKDAKALGRNANSVEEFNQWLEAKTAEEAGTKTKVTKAEADSLIEAINNFEQMLDNIGRSLQDGIDMDTLKEIDQFVESIQQSLDILQGSADIEERPETGE